MQIAKIRVATAGWRRRDLRDDMIKTMRQKHSAAIALLLITVLAGCGSSKTSSPAASTPTQTQTTSGPVLPPAVNELSAAQSPRRSQFPSVHGRSLQKLATLVKASAQFGSATGTFTPGTRRVAFALNAQTGAFIYAPTAVYIAKSPTSSSVRGPFLAPADPMVVAPQFRSRQNTGPGGIRAIYAAQVPLPHAGTYTVLSLTNTGHGLIGAPGEVAVASSSKIPNVGQRPPAIATDTPASVGGNTSLLTTRVPPDDMHQVSFNKFLGKRPIVLLFSTPQLCLSKVCGPVTDIAVQLEHQFGNRVTFIHQEVYVDNQPSKGYRPQLKAFHLQTEPWLFAINRRGIIVDRLEGSFGVHAVTRAIEAALR
jgi:hypothetical protein